MKIYDKRSKRGRCSCERLLKSTLMCKHKAATYKSRRHAIADQLSLASMNASAPATMITVELADTTYDIPEDIRKVVMTFIRRHDSAPI